MKTKLKMTMQSQSRTVLAAASLCVGLLSVSGAVQATLIDRGSGLIFDDVLNITWLQNANLSGTTFDWAGANASANTLVFHGLSGWRLPHASVSARVGPTGTVVNCNTNTEVACRDNEMGYMYYYNLGGTFGQDKTGNQTAVSGVMLDNIQPFYWTGTESPFPNQIGRAHV